MKTVTISPILLALIALLFSCCDNVSNKPRSQTFNIGTHYVKDGKSSSITFSSMEEAERELIHYFFPNGMPIDELPFDRHVFDYDLFEQIVRSNASSMNYPFDSLQHYANIDIIDSPDGNVRYYTWDYPHAHTMSDFHTIIQYRWNGKVLCQKPDTSEDNWYVLSPNSLHILKGKTYNYYLTTAYFRESSNIGYMNFEISKLTKKCLKTVDFWNASYEYFISDWYFRTSGEGYDWLDYFDEKTATLYVAEEDELCLTDRYLCYQWDGSDMKLVEMETVANPHLYPELCEYQRVELFMRTSRNIVRVDQMSNGTYRYAAWKANETMLSKPEIVITGGSYDGDHYVFHNKGYDYYVDDNEVKVTKTGKTIGLWKNIR